MTDQTAHIRDALEAAGIEVNETRPLPTGLGRQLRGAGGQVVVCYDTGKVVVQGKDAERVKAILAAAPATPRPAKVAAPAPPQSAATETTPQPDQTFGEVKPRLPPGWTTEPWDGVSLPW